MLRTISDTLSPPAGKKQSKQYSQYFHQNLRHLTFWILDYKKCDVHKHDSVFGHVRYINILARLRGFWGKNDFFLKFILTLNCQQRLEYKENSTKYRSLSWKAQIHVRILIQYIDRGLSVVVLNGCLLALSESYFFISLVPWCQGGA